MNIFFIRHGETTGDVENRYGGAYDDHLTDKGKEQVKELVQSLVGKGIEVIFSSTLIRAQETSDILAEVLGVPAYTVPDIQERDQYSFLSGMPKDEALKRYPKEVELLKDKLNTIRGAESYEDFAKRIQTGFQAATSSDTYHTIAIVSHGGPIRVLCREVLKLGELEEIGNCSYIEMTKNGNVYTGVGLRGITRKQ